MESLESSNSIKLNLRNYYMDYITQYAHLRELFKLLRVSKKYYKILMNNSRVKEFLFILSELRKSEIILNKSIKKLRICRAIRNII
jgi:hypothetical protein